MVGFVILNYNTWDETYRCVLSICDANVGLQYRIYLVDNASSVKMPIECAKLILEKKVRYIENKSNRGYAAGNNVGIIEAQKDKCDAIVVSNNDIIFNKNVIEKLYEFLMMHDEIGIVAPKILLPNGEIQEVNMGCEMTLKGKYLHMLRKTPLKCCSKSFVEKYKVNLVNKTLPVQVYGVSGCCFMISTKCIETIGLLDENTFLYEEEEIIAYKMNKARMKTIILPYVSVIHKHGQSTKNLKSFSFMCLVESEMYYCRKYLSERWYKIFPLYIIRYIQFLYACFKEQAYRRRIKEFTKRTWRALVKNYGNA